MNELQSLMSQSSVRQDIGPPKKDTVQYQLQLWINHNKCKKSFNLLQKFWSLPAYRDDDFWNNIVNIV